MIFMHKETGVIILVGLTCVQEYSEFSEGCGKISFPGNLRCILTESIPDFMEIIKTQLFVEKFELIGFL